MSSKGTRSTTDASSTNNVEKLHELVGKVLDAKDHNLFIRSLNDYDKNHDVYDLVQVLRKILDTPSKRQLLLLLRQVIPSADQDLFDSFCISGGLYDKKGNKQHTGSSHSHNKKSEKEKLVQVETSAPTSSNTSSNSQVPTYRNVKQITLRNHTSDPSDNAFGFSIRGGLDHGLGIYVSGVDRLSAAEKRGLKLGDQILAVNDVSFEKISHEEAVKIIKASKKLKMLVSSVGRVPGTNVSHQMYIWKDSQGRCVSPPLDLPTNDDCLNSTLSAKTEKTSLKRVNVHVGDGRALGLSIRGGSEFGLGIYITGIDRGSVAEEAGLKIGDEIVEVNSHSFRDVTHAEAAKMLKFARHMILTIRDTGKVPHARSIYDETQWIMLDKRKNNPNINSNSLRSRENSNGSQEANSLQQSEVSAFTKVGGLQLAHGTIIPPARQVIQDQARHLLSEGELRTMGYYLDEYKETNISVDALVLALFELFDSDAKFTLMSEVRSLISAKDIDKFDSLVLKKEIKVARARQKAERKKKAAVAEALTTENNSSVVQHEKSQSQSVTSEISSQTSFNSVRAAVPSMGITNQQSNKPNQKVTVLQNHVELEKPFSKNNSPKQTTNNSEKNCNVQDKNSSFASFTSSGSANLTNLQYVPLNTPPNKNIMPDFDHSNTSDSLLSNRVFRDSTMIYPSRQEDPVMQYKYTISNTMPVLYGGPNSPIYSSTRTNLGYRTKSVSEISDAYTIKNKYSLGELNYNSDVTPSSRERYHRDALRQAIGQIDTNLWQAANQNSHGGALRQMIGQTDASSWHNLNNIAMMSQEGHHQSHRRRKMGISHHQHQASNKLSSSREMGRDPTEGYVIRHNSLPKSYQLYRRPASVLPDSSYSPQRSASLGRRDNKPGLSEHFDPLHPTNLVRGSPQVYQHSLSNGSLRKDQINPELYRRSHLSQHNRVSRPASVPADTLRSSTDVDEASLLSPDSRRRCMTNQSAKFTRPTSIPGLDSNLKFECIIVPKSRPSLGIAIEGGANTRQPLPRIINIQKGGCACECKKLKVGHVILAIDGKPMQGLSHKEAAQAIAAAFRNPDQDNLELFITETPAKKSC